MKLVDYYITRSVHCLNASDKYRTHTFITLFLDSDTEVSLKKKVRWWCLRKHLLLLGCQGFFVTLCIINFNKSNHLKPWVHLRETILSLDLLSYDPDLS